jgi:hypothetical protein
MLHLLHENNSPKQKGPWALIMHCDICGATLIEYAESDDEPKWMVRARADQHFKRYHYQFVCPDRENNFQE